MISSKIFNQPGKVFFIKRRSLAWSAQSVAGVMLLQSMFNFTSLPLVLIATVSPFFVSEYMFKGRFKDENLERTRSRIYEFFGFLPGKFRGKDLSGSKVDRCEEKAIYDVFGKKAVAFEVEPESSEDGSEYYQDLLKTFLDLCGEKVTVKTALVNEELHNDFVKNHRRILKKKGISKQKYLIFLVFPANCSKDKEKETISAGEGLRRLSYEELKAYMGKVVAWRGDEPKNEGHLLLSFNRTGGYLKPYTDDYVYTSASLCTLPTRIMADYSKFFSPCFGLDSIVVTSFTKNSHLQTVMSKGRKTILTKDKETLTSSEKQMLEDLEEDELTGEGTSLTMSQVIMLYGKRSDVDNALLKIQKCKISEPFHKTERPLYLPDNAFVKSALDVCLPLKADHTPDRMHIINNLTEASRYAPTPIIKSSEGGVLVFRNERNGAHWVQHNKGGGGIFQVFQGPTGSGKSTLISHVIKCHMLLRELYNIPAGFVVGDVGGSHTWVKDDYADTTLFFDLADKDENGEFKPLPVNAVSAFIGGRINTVNKKLLADFVLRTMGAKGESAKTESFILAAIDIIAERQEKHSLRSLYNEIAALINNEITNKDREHPVSAEFVDKWEEYLLAFDKICAGGIYGHIFDPDNAKYTDIEGYQNFYFNYDVGDKRLKDLLAPYLDLCIQIGSAIADRHKAGSGEEQATYFILEEFNEMIQIMDDINFMFELKDQARKYGFIPGVAVQSIKYLIMDGLSEDKRKTMFSGLGNFFGYSYDDEADLEIYAIILGVDYRKDDLHPSLAKIKKIHASVMAQKKKEDQSQREYPFFHISPDKVLEKCFMDEDCEVLWAKTTHSGGKQIRHRVMEELNLKTAKEAGLILAETDIWPIPSEIQSEEALRNIVSQAQEVA